MNHSVRLFLKIVFMLMLGSACSLLYLSQDSRCIALVHEKMIMLLERDFGLHFTGTVSSFSLLNTSITCEEVVIHALSGNERWFVKIKKGTFTFLPFRYVFRRKVGMVVDLTDVVIFSEIEQQSLVLVNELQEQFSKPGNVPIELDRCTCSEIVFTALQKEQKKELSSLCSLQIEREKNKYRGELVFKQGSFISSGKKILVDLTGAITIDLNTCESLFSLKSDLSCVLPFAFGDKDRFYSVGSWDGKRGLFSCHTDTQSLQRATIDLMFDSDHMIHVHAFGSVALASCMQCIKFPYPAYASGFCSFDVEGIVGEVLHGSVIMEGSQIAGWHIERLKMSFDSNREELKGSLLYAQKDEQLVGDWFWNNSTQQIIFSMTNETPFSLFGTQWYLPHKQTIIKGALSPALEGTIKYQLSCEQKKTERVFKSHGTFYCKGSDIVAKGAVLAGDSLYHWEALNAGSESSLNGGSGSLVVIDDTQKKQGVPVVKINHNQLQTTAQIDLSLVQNIVRDYANIPFLGQGSLLVQGLWKGSELQGTIELKDGMIRVPSVYNFIHTFQGSFSCNFFKRTLSLERIKIYLQKGTIESASAQMGYDPLAQGMWAHLPLVFTDCFINWEKDLYFLFSGAVIAKKIPHARLALEGFVVLDRSQLKENIFSQKTQRLLMESWSNPAAEKKVDAHISLTTRSPLAVKTEYLETKALLDLVLKSGVDQAELEGAITLQGGAIHFPAHSLSIVKGKIIFTPEQTQDPFIELTAQARVKKYLITLSIGGTVEDPQLVFDSVPSLSEEQVMMLLLAGSEEESLNIVVPTLIMRTMENIIFGSSYRSRTDTWLEPLKRIKFVPWFTDQTGRGGFRGALEIEVSKRLRAIIEKNFSLTEDVAFEVEYLLTDDVSVRASYDERGDVGAEVEMRFKF